MATISDMLNAAANGNALLPGPEQSAQAPEPYIPEALLRGEAMPDADFQSYLDSIVPVTAPTPSGTKQAALTERASSKQSQVAAASDAKKASMSPAPLTNAQYFQNAVGAETGQGAATASELENDLRNMSQFAILAKYGEQGREFIGGQAGGQNTLSQTENAGARSGLQVWDDFNVNVGTGLGSLVGGIGSLGGGLISDELGTSIAESTAEFSDFMRSEQSTPLQQRQRLVEAKNALDDRDNAALYSEALANNEKQYEADVAADGEGIAGLKRIGRDVLSGANQIRRGVVDSIDNATDDSATFGAGVSEALGSFVGVGPLARLVSAGTAGRLGVTTTIAATEAGGAYQQIAADIMDRDHETLLNESPMYRELIASGETPQAAKEAVANRTGLLSAALTAPAAALTGRLVSRFEGDVGAIGAGGLTSTLANVGRETLEEAVQGGTSQFFQNVAESQVANEGQGLTEGVGRQIGEGALYGMGMSAALGAPGATRALGGKAVNAIAERAAGVTEANNQASPVADQRVAVAAAQAQRSAPEAAVVLKDAVEAADLTPEAKVEANSYVDSLLAANSYSATEAPAALQQSMGDVTNRVQAIQRVAEIVNSAEEGSPEQLRAGFYLNTLVQDYTALLNSDPEAMSALPGDSQAAGIIRQYQGLMGAIQNTPKVMTAIDTILTAIEKSEARKAETVDAQTLATPEGQQVVADAIGTAELAPEKGNLGTNEQILYQIEQGNLQVTPAQKAALDTSVALLRAVQAADQAAQANGESDPVSLNISSVDGEKGKSLIQHAKGIMGAWKSGDYDLAGDRLVDLHNFAKGMSNKVGALNSHLAAGNPNAQGLNYEVFVGGKPVTSSAKVAVRTGNQNSVKFAQKVAAEAKLLADVYNGLVTAFPNLGGEHLNVTPLDANLVGGAADVVARYAPAPAAPVSVPEDNTPSVTPAAETVTEVPTTVETPAEPVVQPEPVAEAAPVQEPVPVETVAEAVVEEAPVVAETVEPAPTGMAAAFPRLLSTVPNFFLSAFKLPTQQRTRTIGSETPIADIRSALRDSASLTAFLGSSIQGDFTPEIARAYRDYLSYAEDFVGELDDNLQSFLGNKNMLARVLNGEEANRFVDGKALNITEESDGTLVYNPELIQAAVLAGMQWFLNTDQYGAVMDAKDIADAFGMTEVTVSDTVVEALNQGMSKDEALRSMAQKIKSYWGVTNDANGAIGYQEGIPLAVAAEILRVMVGSGWVNVETTTLTEADGLPALANGKPNVKTVDRYIPNTSEASPLGEGSPLRELPSAIEQAVLLEPEEVTYIGEGNLPPVARDQLRNPGVKNTAQQLAAIKNEQSTPYFVNPHMAGFYTALGRDNVLKLFGAGAIDQRSMNKNHAQSMEGVNRSTVAAFDHLQNLLAQVANSGEIDQTPIYYGFNMTRVARLQMLGKYNPQSNKLVREAILPTRSTLDLSTETGQGYKQYALGLAQLLGVKVHKMSAARSRAKVEAMLNGPLAPSVEALRNWTKGFDNSQVLNAQPLSNAVVDTLAANFREAGEPLTPMALHAVMDYARYMESTDRAAFNTSIYLEADGVTNGPINAMVLFTTGLFRPEWIRNIAKGGLFFNRGAETVNTNVEGGDSNDLYQATTDKLKGFIEALRSEYSGNLAVEQQLDSLFYMMDEFLGGDLQFDGETLTLQRGIAKNPLTITIYGSGAGGIAAKMTKAIMDAVYERMSQVAQAQVDGAGSLAEAMFGPQSSSLEEAQQRLQRFAVAYANLTTKRAKLVDGELAFSGNSAAPTQRLDPVNFTFTNDGILNMQSNMRYMFVEPMRDAIQATVGAELMDTAEILRQATQAQSIVLEHAFKAEVEAALAEKAKDPSWKKGDFLTVRELEAVRKKLEHLSPLVQTENQNFFIAGSQTVELGLTDFARSLDGRLRTNAFVDGPKDAGVSGIPFMNIGAGDGQMMQNISVARGAPTGTLKIFDGMNMPLDQIESGSQVANQAVYDSWMGNPLAAVHKSFSDFMKDANLKGMSKEQRLALSKALFGLASDIQPEGDVIQAMQDLVDQLNAAQLSIEARHRTMARVQISIDQMAAAASPYVRQGDVPLAGTDADAIADQLNAIYNIELERLRDGQTTRRVDQDFYDMATEHESGALVMNGADLSQVGEFFPANQRAVLAEIVSSLAAQDYNIVMGTAEQIAEYNAAESLPSASSTPTGQVSGYINVGSKTIYLLNPSTETFTHELIHAASFEATLAHYAGAAPKHVSDAVGRLEAMMEQFRGQASELAQTSEQVNNTYNSALSAINGYLAAGNKAAALNEFMAWSLASESLSRIAERTQVSKLGKMREAVVGFIKKLLGIQASAGKDLFSNLLFNSSILMHSQPKLSERFTASTLFQNSIYGDSDRLTSINEALDKTLGRYLEEAPVSGRYDPQSAMHKAIQNGYRVAESFMAHGFNMNMQEASTFKTIVTALSTEAAIDPNSMAAVQTLYSHVMKNLSVESFMADPNSTNPADRYYAAEKFDVLSGKFLVTQDVKGRSSLLPAFLALATTNTEFRSVLENMDLPRSSYNGAGTLDALLENMGNKAMDSLGQRMAGQSKKATNVQAAIDSLNAHMAKVINDRETFIDQMASTGQGVLDRANDLTVNGLTQLSNGLLKLATRAQRNGASKLERAVAGIGAGVAAVINETAAEGVAQATMASINKTNMWNSVHTLINDLVGRTQNNANVYDMIKAVKSVVQRTRQQYREDLPVLLASKFSRELTDAEWNSLHTSMGKTDLAALMTGNKPADVLNLVANPAELTKAIAALEADLASPNFALHQRKAKQLSNFMLTGVPGTNLLRNAEAVARLYDETPKGKPVADVAKLDRLISLYALDALSQGDKDTLASLVQEEAEGTGFLLSYLKGQREEEVRKSTGMALMNAYKGYIPQSMNEGVSIKVEHDSQHNKLLQQSYVRVGDYAGSSLERGLNRGYYFIPVAARGAFEQGIMQNVVQTAGGVNAATGLSIAQTAGAITDAADVKFLIARMKRESGTEPLMPVRDENGSIIAFERSLDPEVMQRVYGDNNLAQTIGMWRGRQVEEGFSQTFNERLIDNLNDMYEKDLRESADNARQYVDVLQTTDPVLKDAVRLMSRETKAYVEQVFGNRFMVRKDMLNDAFGYRSASVGDFWTGNTRWSSNTQKTVRNLAVAAMGNEAYKTLMNAEQLVQNLVADAKVLIVVKSVVVPAVNMISNMFQLAARGVPLKHIASSMPKKTAEVEAYTRSLVRRIEAEAELRAATGDQRAERRLKTEIQAINDSHRRMSIWPLIEAGEFTGISDAGMTRAEIQLTSGRMQAYLEQAAAKLPGGLATAGRYALVTKDTALFQGLQKAVEYGDFLAKATLYDDLIGRKGLTPQEALARVTEEFVNYDRLSGRFRGSMESMGLLWFYNFKIRSAKVAASMIRNNPIHTLLATLTPAPTMFGTVGLPTEDNIFAKLYDGTLDRSIGPGQGLSSMMLNPWVNLTQ